MPPAWINQENEETPFFARLGRSAGDSMQAVEQRIQIVRRCATGLTAGCVAINLEPYLCPTLEGAKSARSGTG